MGFLKPSVPAPPPPPPLPPAPAVKPVSTAERDKLQRRVSDPRRMGRQRTIVTGPRGLTGDQEEITRKSLIGTMRGSPNTR
jgi:hypothetical protein